jgi:hypothetical protein
MARRASHAEERDARSARPLARGACEILRLSSHSGDDRRRGEATNKTNETKPGMMIIC